MYFYTSQDLLEALEQAGLARIEREGVDDAGRAMSREEFTWSKACKRLSAV